MVLRIERSDLVAMCYSAKKFILDGIMNNQDVIFKNGIDTALRLEHFLSQCAHESAGFTTTAEFASGKAYNGRRDLGNVKPGDGPLYKGHGLIQTTGRTNHRLATIDIRKMDPTCPDFEADPWELTKFPWALYSAISFWNRNRLNRFADRDDIRRLTKAINGGYNGLEDRTRYRNRARGLFNN